MDPIPLYSLFVYFTNYRGEVMSVEAIATGTLDDVKGISLGLHELFQRDPTQAAPLTSHGQRRIRYTFFSVPAFYLDTFRACANAALRVDWFYHHRPYSYLWLHQQSFGDLPLEAA